MKKFTMTLLSAGLLISSSLQAVENAGGADGSVWASGKMKKEAIVIGTFVAGLVVAGAANSSGSIVKGPVSPVCEDDEVLVGGVCTPVEQPEAECTGTDPLVDGVCIGTTTTTSVTVSGTTSTTIYIPVTYTYLPTIPS